MSLAPPVGRYAGDARIGTRWTGDLLVPTHEWREALRQGWAHDGLDGWDFEERGLPGDLTRVAFLAKVNLVVDIGVQRALRRLFAIGGPPDPLETIGVDDGTVNPQADFVSSTNGDGATGGSTNRRLVAFDSTPTLSTLTISADGTFTQANVSFVMKRLFLSEEEAGTTDADGTLYAMTDVFTMDLTTFSAWSQTFTAQVTGSGS